MQNEEQFSEDKGYVKSIEISQNPFDGLTKFKQAEESQDEKDSQSL